MNYLTSYNHSGNTWVRYCIEYLTQLPTHGHQAFSISERENNFLNVDLTKPPIVIKRHEMKLSELKDDDKLILLIRDPKDAIKCHLNVQREFYKYYNLVGVFDWFAGKKLCIKYKDLFRPSTIMSILDFYELEMTSRFADFIGNFALHQEISKGVYRNTTMQKGSDIENFIPKDLLDYVYRFV